MNRCHINTNHKSNSESLVGFLYHLVYLISQSISETSRISAGLKGVALTFAGHSVLPCMDISLRIQELGEGG